MEPIPVIAVAAVVLAVVGVIIVFAVRYERARDQMRLEVWRRFASERGFRLLEPTGPWYRRTPHAVEGKMENVPFRLDTYVVSTGKSHITYTRVRGELDRPFPGQLEVWRRNFFTKLAEKLGRRSLHTGDSAFDTRMTARSKAGEAALGVLDADVRSRASSFPRSARLRVSGREVTVFWIGAERDLAVLEAACNLIAATVRACAKV